MGAGMVVSMPIAVFSTAGYILYGSVDFVLGTALGLVAVAGVVVVARIAHAPRPVALRRAGVWALLTIGLLITVQMVW
jgi:uncharacterized membrane protein YfcA